MGLLYYLLNFFFLFQYYYYFFFFLSLWTSKFVKNYFLICSVGVKLSFIILILSFYLCQKKFWLIHSLATTFYVFDFVGIFFKCVLLIAVAVCLLISVEFLIRQQLISFEYF